MLDLLDHLQVALDRRYTIQHEIGHGGMAVVYLAEDHRHERTVALKVLQPRFSEVLGADRFLREIKVAARMHHPHLLPLYDSGEAGGLPLLRDPYVEGGSLRQRLTQEDLERADLGQIGDEPLCHPIAEVGAVRAGPELAKGEDRRSSSASVRAASAGPG